VCCAEFDVSYSLYRGVLSSLESDHVLPVKDLEASLNVWRTQDWILGALSTGDSEYCRTLFFANKLKRESVEK